MESLRKDLRFGFRMLAKSPGFTVAAVLALALGIGANTAVFSIVNAVLVQPLPYADPDRVTFVLGWDARENDLRFSSSTPDFVDWQRQNQVFADLSAYRFWSVNITGGDLPERVQGYRVTANTFALLGVEPLIGRGFLSEEGEPGRDRVVVLNHGLWKQRFASDPNIVGETITLNGAAYTVVGVMPPKFEYPQFNFKGDLWAPLALTPDDLAPDRRANASHVVVGRLKSDVTLEQAQAEMDTICQRLEQQYPDTNTSRRARVIPIAEMNNRIVRPALLALLVAVGFALLIACANVANMLLARAAGRTKEMAIRTALGASRWRLVRQLLSESLLLALVGAGFGIVLAMWGLDVLRANIPEFVANVQPSVLEIGVDDRVLLFTLGLAVLTSLIFGLVPALRSSGTDLHLALKEGGQTSPGLGRQRLRSALVVAEVAFSLVLLMGAGLMIRSFTKVLAIHPGFESKNLVTVDLSLSPTKYPEDRQQAAYAQEALRRVTTLPGVGSASVISTLPFSTASESADFTIDGQPASAPGETPRTGFDRVSPEYFRTMKIPLLSGRVFTEQDRAATQPVAIISQSLARRFWPNQDPLGQRIQFGRAPSPGPWIVIVGVVGDVRDSGDGGPRGSIQPEIYVPFEQAPRNSMTLVVRADANSTDVVAAIRTELRTVDPDQPIYNVKTMDQILGQTLVPLSYSTTMMAIFAVIALVLAAVGLYSVMSYSVMQRTHEMGIRMALGARPRDVLRLMVRQGLVLTTLGTAIGLGGAFALSQLMSSLLYEVSATDPTTYVSVSLLLMGVALLACYLPARRATRVDPIVALRYE